MEPKPKERIVFDEDSYYGDEGEEMAINDLMERDGLTEDEVREDFTDDEIFNHQMEMKDFDYEEEMRALAAFFNGEKSDMSDFVNPYGGNHILVSGSVGRWNGTSTGIAVYKDFDAATDCSPSRFGQGNVFADCEIQKVWDENGTLYLAGAHHDGRVSVEMQRTLTMPAHASSLPAGGACISSIPVNPARMAAYQKARMKIPPAVTRWSSSTIPRITGSS